MWSFSPKAAAPSAAKVSKGPYATPKSSRGTDIIGLGTVVEGELVGPMNWLSKDWLVRNHLPHLGQFSRAGVVSIPSCRVRPMPIHATPGSVYAC